MKMRSKMQNQKGFTLVELMVVVVILGILVAIAVPVYNSIQTKAAEKACLANLRTVDGAYQMYLADKEGVDITGDDWEALMGVLSPEWIQEEPECPGEGVYTWTKANGARCSVHKAAPAP